MSTLQERRYEVLAICPDIPAGLEEVHSGKKLDFPLYSDSSIEVSAALGIAFHMDDETVDLYLNKYKVDLEKASGEKHHNLPVPAVIVVNAKNIVQFCYTNANHEKRLSNKELLEIAK